jgi:hypothetical protein
MIDSRSKDIDRLHAMISRDARLQCTAATILVFDDRKEAYNEHRCRLPGCEDESRLT